MTLAEIIADPAFVRLSDGQKMFVRSIVTNGRDKVAAAKVAWNPKDDTSAEALANQALRRPVISRLVNAYFGTTAEETLPTRDEVLTFLWKKANNSKEDADSIRWMALYMKIGGLEVKAAEQSPSTTPKEQDAIDDLLTEIENRGK